MQFSELTIRLLLIFFPGLISAVIVDSLTTHKGREFKVFLLNSFLFGLTSYFFVYIFVCLNNLIVKMNGFKPNQKMNFLVSLMDGKSEINITEVLITSVVAIFLGFLISFIINSRLIHKFAVKFKITKKFGELDVWAYVFELPTIEWVTVRDLKNDLMYQGWVEAFSDTHEESELFLRDVVVYRNSTSEEMYRVDGIYLTGESNSLLLEFQNIN
ncbi:hypothetical protein [Bacillus cereus group sp. MYBK58-1]|uniref:hypothetical protein n=1 Tax=unclassified Bacillus cereus group TaxID=2750818 RepID=UPI003F79D430